MISNTEIEQQKIELLEKYPNEYYSISDYGYGDGSCDGPFNAFEALEAYSINDKSKSCLEIINEGLFLEPLNKKPMKTLVSQFKDALKTIGMTKIHYISLYDLSNHFNFMNS